MFYIVAIKGPKVNYVTGSSGNELTTDINKAKRFGTEERGMAFYNKWLKKSSGKKVEVQLLEATVD